MIKLECRCPAIYKGIEKVDNFTLSRFCCACGWREYYMKVGDKWESQSARMDRLRRVCVCEDCGQKFTTYLDSLEMRQQFCDDCAERRSLERARLQREGYYDRGSEEAKEYSEDADIQACKDTGLVPVLPIYPVKR